MEDSKARKDYSGPETPSQSLQKVSELWRQVSEESSQPALLLEQWTQDISIWANLREWIEAFMQDVRSGTHLWFPGADESQLRLLIALADLAEALGCSTTELVEVLLKNTQVSAHSPFPAVDVPPSPEDPPKQIYGQQAGEKRTVDYRPLIEALYTWQAIFELALDKAASQLGREQFPAEDLSASLSEMCDLVRAVLDKNSSH